VPSDPPPQRHRLADFAAARWPAILLVVLAAIFVAQNRDRVSVSLLGTHFMAPMWLLLTVLFVAGVATGSVSYRRRARARKDAAT